MVTSYMASKTIKAFVINLELAYIMQNWPLLGQFREGNVGGGSGAYVVFTKLKLLDSHLIYLI